MKTLAIALLFFASNAALEASDLRHAGHFIGRLSNFLGRHRSEPAEPRYKLATEMPPPMGHPRVTGLRPIKPEDRAGRPDTFVAYQNAMNRWHASGHGLDKLWDEYQKREAEYVEDYTARFGREATAAASARAVAANPGHALVTNPIVLQTTRRKRCRLWPSRRRSGIQGERVYAPGARIVAPPVRVAAPGVIPAGNDFSASYSRP